MHEMRAESAEAKVAAKAKLTEARTMMEDALRRFTEVQAKLNQAASLESEAQRYHRAAERKLREVEEREDDLRKRLVAFKFYFDTKDSEIQRERQTIREILQNSKVWSKKGKYLDYIGQEVRFANRL